MTMTSAFENGYAPVNGLEMYYESHGAGRPLVLLHGAMSGIGTSFEAVLPSLAVTRRVIAVEQQAHGHTADVDRPLTLPQMADDTAELLRGLGVMETDVLGYSMGAGIGVELALRHPDLVRKLVLVSVTFDLNGFHPGLIENVGNISAEDMVGSPFHTEFVESAPNPDGWANLVQKVTVLNTSLAGWPPEVIASIGKPVQLVVADSDIVTPEHAVQMFRALGGGVVGDVVGLPSSRLAILPGTTHMTITQRADWLVPMVHEFLDAEESE